MLNGEERFVVKSISRSEIAAMMNDVINEKQLTVPLFGEGDPRLTSRLCGALVDSLALIYDGGFSREDLGYEERTFILTFIIVHFK